MPQIGTKGFAEISLRDVSAELTTTRIRTATLSAGNFAAQATAKATFYAAVAAMVLGQVASTNTGNGEIISNAASGNDGAHRELKLMLIYWDVITQKEYQITIGTINSDHLHFLPQAGDAVAFKASEGADSNMTDLVAAFEAVAQAPDTGNAVAVIGARLVGRNN